MCHYDDGVRDSNVSTTSRVDMSSVSVRMDFIALHLGYITYHEHDIL